MTSIWNVFATFSPEYRRGNSEFWAFCWLGREKPGEKGIRREIPKQKTGPPGDFARRREIIHIGLA
jgi:hypothetical protein